MLALCIFVSSSLIPSLTSPYLSLSLSFLDAPYLCGCSYLPLAHIFETVLQVLGMCGGASVGFYQGNVKLLTSDIQALRPTVFAGVPRVYARFYDKVWCHAAPVGCTHMHIHDLTSPHLSSCYCPGATNG